MNSILQLRDSCEEQQEILEEQLTYMVYMDTEYDVRPWRPSEDGVVEVADSDNHTAIKTKLDTEVSTLAVRCSDHDRYSLLLSLILIHFFN